MRKITRKILGPLAVLAMALGVGLSVAKTKDIKKVEALPEVGTYTITGKDTLAQTGVVPTDSSASLVETYGTSKQMTSGNSQTVTLTGYGCTKITQITLSARSNAKGGAGNFTYSLDGGNTYTDIIATAAFNTDSWNGAWSTTYVPIVKAVDIVVSDSATLILKVAATANSLYVESYALTWEEIVPEELISLTMNKSTATMQVGDEEVFSVAPTPASASASVSWSSSNGTVASVDSTGKVTANSIGLATITATSTVKASVTATVDITVVAAKYYDLAAAGDLMFGATYTIATDSAVGFGMNNDVVSTTVIGYYSATYNLTSLRHSPSTMLLSLEMGTVADSFAFKILNGNKVGEYLTLNKNDNYLQTSLTKNDAASWTISFSGDDAVIKNVTYNTRTIRYNTAYPRFAAYTTGQTAVQLFVDSVTKTAANAANSYANDVMNGVGAGANKKCGAIKTVLDNGYSRLSATAQGIFDSSSEELFVNARARRAYLEAWVAANPPAPVRYVDRNNNSIAAAVAIGVIGLTAMFGYYFLTKKKRLA